MDKLCIFWCIIQSELGFGNIFYQIIMIEKSKSNEMNVCMNLNYNNVEFTYLSLEVTYYDYVKIV